MDMILSKQQRIAQAAEHVFAKRGYDKATVDEIINIANVGKGTLYKYFGNKEQLFYKLVSHKNASFVQRLEASIISGQSFEQKLVSYFTEMITFYRANAALWQIILFEMLGGSTGYMVRTIGGKPTVTSRYGLEPSKEFKEQLIRYHLLLESEFIILQNLIQKAVASGELKPVDPEVATMYIFFGVAMCIFQPYTTTDNLSSADFAALTVDRFVYGVSALPRQ